MWAHLCKPWWCRCAILHCGPHNTITYRKKEEHYVCHEFIFLFSHLIYLSDNDWQLNYKMLAKDCQRVISQTCSPITLRKPVLMAKVKSRLGIGGHRSANSVCSPFSPFRSNPWFITRYLNWYLNSLRTSVVTLVERQTLYWILRPISARVMIYKINRGELDIRCNARLVTIGEAITDSMPDTRTETDVRRWPQPLPAINRISFCILCMPFVPIIFLRRKNQCRKADIIFAVHQKLNEGGLRWQWPTTDLIS